MPAEERGALAESCRSGPNFKPWAGKCVPWPEGHGPSAHRHRTWDGVGRGSPAGVRAAPRHAAVPGSSHVALLHSSPVKEMNDHRRSGMGTQEQAMGTLPL